MAAETSIVSELAARYATALFELARDERALDAVADDLARLQGMLEESEELRRLVRSPLLSRDDQGKGMAAVLSRAEIGSLVARFVAVAARNRRLFALEAIIGRFNRLLAAHRGEVAAEVTSAVALSAAQLEALKDSLSRLTGSEVKVSAKVDGELLGGMIVRLGSRMVDSSLRTKLMRLQFAMKGAG